MMHINVKVFLVLAPPVTKKGEARNNNWTPLVPV
jgi:hypothetical protein